MHSASFRLDCHIALAIALTAILSGNAQTKPAGAPAKTKDITISEGTDMAVTAAPDQKTIIMDLQGLLYSMPMAGGTAKQISTPYDEDSHPDWSAKGGIIAVQSYGPPTSRPVS
jgi:Tol biopolymer transport system component